MLIFWMLIMSLMIVLWLADALKFRARAKALKILPQDGAESDLAVSVLARVGASLDPQTLRSATNWLQTQDLDAIILVAGNWSAKLAWLGLQAADPKSFRDSLFLGSTCAGELVVMRREIAERFELSTDTPQAFSAWTETVTELKKCLGTRMDLALAPDLIASPAHDRDTLGYVEAIFGPIARPFLLVQSLLLLSAPWVSPVLGVLALACYHLQPLALLGLGRLQPRGLLSMAASRLVFDLRFVLRAKTRPSPTSLNDMRERYKASLAQGIAPFFEEKRHDCPLCGSTQLGTALASRDMIQLKPGIFEVSQCHDCQHLFQNPRLSVAGLNFYYGDFYDGLGRQRVERLFAQNADPYQARAELLKGRLQPRRWLDVGAGHGHFCQTARRQWPGVTFDGLDLNEGVKLAERRGWIDRAYHGLFPDLAESLSQAARYDVVSMSHYLEHTRDPEAEIASAAKVLAQGGYLLIELPDPESKLGRWFGSYWMPWFQPQHQHMLSAQNLERLLTRHAFQPVCWQRGEAHQAADFTLSLGLLLNRWAPPLDLPWRAPSRAWQRLWNTLVYLCGLPLLIIARLMDKLSAPFMRRQGWSNAYRVLAQRVV